MYREKILPCKGQGEGPLSLRNKVSSNIPLLFLVLLVSFVVRVPSFDEPFCRDDGANAYGANLILQGEPLYSTFHPSHHLPAIYYTYAFAFRYLGNGHQPVKIFLALWTVMGTFLIYKLGELMYGSASGLVSALLFGLFSAGVTNLGTTAEIELFANLPITAVVLVFYLSESKSNRPLLMLVGAFGAIAFLFKAPYVLVLLAVTASLLWDLLGSRSKQSLMRFGVKNILIYSGFVAILIPVGIYFHLNGLFSELLSVFTLGAAYTGESLHVTRFFCKMLMKTFVEFRENSILWIVTTANITVLFRKGQWRLRSNRLMLLWLLFSFIEVGFSGKFYHHYYLLLIPPMSVLAGDGIAKILKILKRDGKLLQSISSLYVIFALVSTPLLFYGANYKYYRNYLEYKVAGKSEEEFLSYFEDTLTFYRIADYIRGNTEENDYIYVSGWDPYIYYLSGTRCPTKYFWPHTMRSFDIEVQAQLHQQILDSGTKYVVLLSSPPSWLAEGLNALYELETIIDGRSIYVRR